MAYRILLILFLIQYGLAINPCCDGENRLVKKRCIDGTSATKNLNCTQKYLANKDNSTSIKNDHLVIGQGYVPADRFCWSEMNGTEIYIVCFENADSNSSMYTINAILELISVLFLVFTIVIYLQVPDLLDLQGVCILHSISGLAVSFVVLAINQLSTSIVERPICLLYAYLTYVSMLYAFFWLNALSFHIWRTVIQPGCFKSFKRWSYVYYAIGYGGPIALFVMLLIASSMEYSDMHPGFGETKCWFKSAKGQFIYFYLPMALLLCLNIVYYGWTIAVLWKNLGKCDEKKAKVLRYRLRLCFKLFVIMGISWIFELLSAALDEVHPVLHYIWRVTDCLNTLQGIFIFLILVVFRKRAIRLMAERTICFVRLPNRWRNAADDECDEIEEEFRLSETQMQKS